MVLLMQGFFIISCEIPVFPADNVPMSAGEKNSLTEFVCANQWLYTYTGVLWGHLSFL